VGVHVLRLPLSAETAWLRAPGDDRPRRSRRRPGYLSCVGGRTAELSSDHPTPERRQHAYAHGQKCGLATRDGPQYSGQSHLYRAGPVQLSAARAPPVAEEGGAPTAVAEDGAELSHRERMDLERSASPYYR